MRAGSMPFAGALAVTSGAVGIAAALLSLPSADGMDMPMTPVTQALPSILLLVFSGIVLVHGILLIVGTRIGPRSQGGLMVVYGAIMVLVGVLMAATSVFPMQMAVVSALAMFGLGGLMVVSGFIMFAGRSMAGT